MVNETRGAVQVEDFQPIPPGHAYPGMPWPADRGGTWEEHCAAAGMVRARYWAGGKHGVAFRPSVAGPAADLQAIADALATTVHFTVIEPPDRDQWDNPRLGFATAREADREAQRQRANWHQVRSSAIHQ